MDADSDIVDADGDVQMYFPLNDNANSEQGGDDPAPVAPVAPVPPVPEPEWMLPAPLSVDDILHHVRFLNLDEAKDVALLWQVEHELLLKRAKWDNSDDRVWFDGSPPNRFGLYQCAVNSAEPRPSSLHTGPDIGCFVMR